MRFFRQLMGWGRREAAADEAMRAHKEEHIRELQAIKRSNQALKQLVEAIHKDVTAWP